MRDAKLIGLFCLVYGCSVNALLPAGVAQYGPPELEPEFMGHRRDGLHGQSIAAFDGGPRNASFGRLQTVPVNQESSSRLFLSENDDFSEQTGTSNLRDPEARRVRHTDPHQARKTQQRYLPYSPSYRSANRRATLIPEDLFSHGQERLLSRHTRDVLPGQSSNRKVDLTGASGPISPADLVLFQYDVNLAVNSRVTATQQSGPLRPAPANPQTSPDISGISGPDIMAFDIGPGALNPPAGSPPQINPAQFQRAMGPAMRNARQDFMQKVANPRPSQCQAGPSGGKTPPMIWAVGQPSPNTRFAYQSEFAGRRLADQFMDGNADNLFAYLQQDDNRQPDDTSDCYSDQPVDCDPDSPYRTQDGTCNNLQNPLQGSANYRQSRLGPAEYEDGISEPRRLSLASRIQNRPILLPSAREVSVAISQNLDIESKKITYMFNQFGQFIAHDVTNTPVETVTDPQNPKKPTTPTCCGTDPACAHPACYPILIPANDPVYGQYGIDCMEFVRSQPAAQSGCRLGTRIQLNAVTSYIDGSQIYGSNTKDTNRLRAKRKGLLRTNDSPICADQNLVMVPGGTNVQGCVSPSADMPCLDAGDLRVNQHTGLVAIHSLFLRLHNDIANFITKKRSDLSDEVVFQHVRKIVGGIIQHVYFKEVVPIIVGRKLASNPDNGLALTKKGYCDCYDDSIDASMQVEFAAGAYRFHTLQDNTLPVEDENGVEYPIYQHFFNPNMWYKPGIVDELLRNLPSKPAEGFDPQFTFIFQNQVFKPTNKPTGIDMMAMNNQRGRDHGMPAYVKMREICGLSPVKTFRDLERVMPKDAADNLASVYRHIRDIDFYAGGISERPVNKDGLVGPTFACVLSNQFQKLKNGDRFWYENEGVFSPAVLKAIRRTSMALLLCAHADVQEMQPHALLIASESNPITPCQDIKGDIVGRNLGTFLQDLPHARRQPHG